MTKSQQEDKSKRYSKISNALKSYFFKLIYVKELTIKEVSFLFKIQSARICRLNYSTAKAIIRDLTDKEKEYIQNQISQSKIMKQLNFCENFERSDYRETSNSNDSEVSRTIFGQVANYHGLLIPRPIKRINIISTTGFDFLKTSNIKVES